MTYPRYDHCYRAYVRNEDGERSSLSVSRTNGNWQDLLAREYNRRTGRTTWVVDTRDESVVARYGDEPAAAAA